MRTITLTDREERTQSKSVSHLRAWLPYVLLALLSGMISSGIVHLRQERAGKVCSSP